ncbi:uncharacterized protein LAESUDRAFT_655737 [Laetiporus sulphureus 93-53]|uniref:Uncharacterized protein n=1 Tax=Laetiporus sulphureus 93-53 TaxID=1314785 RepID=A0A165DRQ6_9APHY|nr:uncharacterized protein LAESUDRAFT_655737 [Laetiporus sulphureus 93-53]KZT05489.1 hypothetical protein LAESUDRAFT_655737 [Laetiporus sulphureus 93-53]
MLALLETRRLDLQGAQSYLKSTDVASETDVVRMVRILNTEIFQTVKLMASSFTVVDDPMVATHAADSLRSVLGRAVTDLLLSFPNHHDDTIVLEISLQSVIVLVVRLIISSWDLSARTSLNKSLTGAYIRLLASEDQSVAARWRSLTLRYLPQESADGKSWMTFFNEELATFLSVVFNLAGGRGDVPGAARDNIHNIVSTAFELRRMLSDDILGADYVVTLGVTGNSFSSEAMDDAYPTRGRRPKAGTRILCPFELGLHRFDKVDEEFEETLKESVVIRPKVVLESLIDDLKTG